MPMIGISDIWVGNDLNGDIYDTNYEDVYDDDDDDDDDDESGVELSLEWAEDRCCKLIGRFNSDDNDNDNDDNNDDDDDDNHNDDDDDDHPPLRVSTPTNFQSPKNIQWGQHFCQLCSVLSVLSLLFP